MVALFFKAFKMVVGLNREFQRENCVAVLLQIEDKKYQLNELFNRIEELRHEWGYTNVMIVPFNHLGDASIANPVTCHQAYYKMIQHYREDLRVEVVPYSVADYKMQLSVSGDDRSVRNARFHSKKTPATAIKWMLWDINYIQLGLISPATLPIGIRHEEPRSLDPAVLHDMEGMSKCLLVFFQVGEHCCAEDVKIFCDTIARIAEDKKKKKLFVSAFGHLTAQGSNPETSRAMFLHAVTLFESMPQLTVKHSHFGWNKNFDLQGICFKSGRYVSKKTEPIEIKKELVLVDN